MARKDGAWKVALDLGIENPEPTSKPEAFRAVVPMTVQNRRMLMPLAKSGPAYNKNLLRRTEQGHYFQIWQTDAAGSWKRVLDWQQALPK